MKTKQQNSLLRSKQSASLTDKASLVRHHFSLVYSSLCTAHFACCVVVVVIVVVVVVVVVVGYNFLELLKPGT